jgi:gp16 family phage-associated protein
MASPAEIKALFVAQGWSVADWARGNGFPANLVYRVLRGETDCRRGKTHQIGIALGIKTPPSEEMRRMVQTLSRSHRGSNS